MIKIHEKASRGRTQNGWLDSYHTFSFGQFQDPTRMGFANLRVINEDTVIPGGGFSPHDHAEMDILTIVFEGQLRHEDDQGNIATISKGEIQGMSAGTGVRHSEYNASHEMAAKFLQIWLIPDQMGLAPTYAQATIPVDGDVLLAGPRETGALINLRSDARLTLRRFTEGQRVQIPADGTHDRFVHLLDGLVEAETERVSAGDGLQIPRSEPLDLIWVTDGAALEFQMPTKARQSARPAAELTEQVAQPQAGFGAADRMLKGALA